MPLDWDNIEISNEISLTVNIVQSVFNSIWIFYMMTWVLENNNYKLPSKISNKLQTTVHILYIINKHVPKQLYILIRYYDNKK